MFPQKSVKGAMPRLMFETKTSKVGIALISFCSIISKELQQN